MSSRPDVLSGGRERGSVIDITARTRPEQALAKLAAIVESSDDAIISKDLNGIIESWNRGAERLFGYTAEEAVGRSIIMLFPPEKVDEELTILDRIRRGERIEHYETVRRRKDGTLLDVSLAVSPILDGEGNPVGASKIARDITERKRFEEALRWSEAVLEAELADTKLLHGISSAIIHEGSTEALYEKIVDAAVAIMHSDFASMQMLYPERGKGGELRLLAFRGFNPQAAKHWEWVRADSECTCGIALRSGMRVIEPDVARPQVIPAGTPDQETCLQTGIRAVQSTPLRSRSGELVGMISTHWRQTHRPSERDVSLLDILARQAADLIERKRAEDALRESDRRKDEFLAILSHELRNPLAPMRHAVTLLQQADDDEEIRRQASTILDRQLQHMTRLVEDLLDISRISRGHIDIRKQNVDLGAVILTATETTRPLVEAAGHRLDITLPGTPIKVFADRLRLAQVVSNLLNNAAKYTPRGGRIGVKVSRAPAEATISVRDNGIGISADDLPRLFNMFTQLDGARRRTPAGLGVGLALSRQLVELHGGTIEAHSEGPDKGSEFVVRIPLAGADRPSGASA